MNRQTRSRRHVVLAAALGLLPSVAVVALVGSPAGATTIAPRSGAVAVVTREASPAAYTTATFGYPGATSTTPSGIDDRGVIVGTYTNPDSSQHGFRYNPRTGTFTTLDYPTDSSGTIVADINASGHVAGYYFPVSGGVANFIKSRSQYQTYDIAGQYGTYSQGINNADDTVGFSLTGGQVAGWERVDGVVTFFQVEDTNTSALDINNKGDIAGYDQYQNQHGYLRAADGTITILQYPDAGAVFTVASGVNDRDVVVGSYSGGRYHPSHGYVYRNGTFRALPDVPGATSTIPSKIDNRGVIVGRYQDGSGNYQGFIMTPR